MQCCRSQSPGTVRKANGQGAVLSPLFTVANPAEEGANPARQGGLSRPEDQARPRIRARTAACDPVIVLRFGNSGRAIW